MFQRGVQEEALMRHKLQHQDKDPMEKYWYKLKGDILVTYFFNAAKYYSFVGDIYEWKTYAVSDNKHNSRAKCIRNHNWAKCITIEMILLLLILLLLLWLLLWLLLLSTSNHIKSKYYIEIIMLGNIEQVVRSIFAFQWRHTNAM